MNLSTHFDDIQPMPLDRCTITTSFRINSAVITDTAAFRKQSGLELREFKPSIKTIKGEDLQRGTLHVGSYGGLSIYLAQSQDGRWRAKTIHINPGKILYGHNGRPLSETECLTAFSIAIDLLTPLLAKPGDAIHLIPGTSPDSEAYWSMLEIPMHLHDPDGSFQHAFRNPSHPSIRKPAFRVEGESVKLGAPRGHLHINFYRKDLELADVIRKHNGPDVPRILRVEVTLRGKRLVKAFRGDGNTRMLNDNLRLINFSGNDLMAVHSRIVSELKGCYSLQRDASGKPDKNKLGRYMAHVANQSPLSLDDQLDIYENRFGFGRDGKSRTRNAALEELSRLSPFSFKDVFSPEAYQNQPSIAIPELERYMQARRDNTAINPLVAAAYGSSTKSLTRSTPH